MLCAVRRAVLTDIMWWKLLLVVRLDALHAGFCPTAMATWGSVVTSSCIVVGHVKPTVLVVWEPFSGGDTTHVPHTVGEWHCFHGGGCQGLGLW